MDIAAKGHFVHTKLSKRLGVCASFMMSILFCPDVSEAMNREGESDGGFNESRVTDFEEEGTLQRDSMGRKIVISPNSNIDPDSLQLDIAPWSTVILNVRQINKGKQTTITPFYRNVEMPE